MSNEKVIDLQQQIITAMKRGDRTRLDVLRMLISRTKLIAKNDGNREATDSDLISAATKTIKETSDTRALYLERGVSTSKEDAEISIVTEFLPAAMDEATLRAKIQAVLATAREPKKARGVVMKELSTNHKGEFNPQDAQRIIAELLA